MAFFTQEGTIKFETPTMPAPRYDIEPSFATRPLPGAMRRQIAGLLARAISDAIDAGTDFEGDDEIDPMWQVDWGQMLESGTELDYLSDIVSLVDQDDLGRMLLTAFYTAARVVLASNDEAITEIMADVVMSMMLGGTMEAVPRDGSSEADDGRPDGTPGKGEGDGGR